MRITLAAWGSFGDLHPTLAVALGLKSRGHSVTICTCALYREKVGREGLTWTNLRPDLPGPGEDAPALERLMDSRRGTEAVLKEWIVPHLQDSLADLRAAIRGADLFVCHPVLYAGPIAAHLENVPWASTFLAPISLPSAYSLPVPPSHPSMGWARKMPVWFARPALEFGKRQVRPWVGPVDELRKAHGIPNANPIFEGMHSPTLNLALFSRALGQPMPDWPANTIQTGFPFYDRLHGGVSDGLSPELEAFLASGDAPILFTLGSSAVMTAGSFFADAALAAKKLNRRGVLLVGRGVAPPPNLPASVLAVDYAPHSLLMPRCSVIVHQGGVGTTGQALRSGRPQLVVPFSHDQPDNGWRVAHAGAGRVLPKAKVGALSLTFALRQLLETPSYARRAEALAQIVAGENGGGAACDAIERTYGTIRN